MSSHILLNPTKCLRRSILINFEKNRFYSFRKCNENCMFIVKKKEGITPTVTLSLVRNKSFSNPSGNPGCGAGKGGGGGGTVRESGGGLGQYGAAQEEQFFFNKQREQLKELKKKMLEGKDLTRQKDK